MLQPGANRLAFQVTVLKPGLYTLKHLHVRLGRQSLRLRAALPDDEGPPVELLTAPPLMPVLSEAQSTAQQPAIGDVDTSGELMAPSYMINVTAENKSVSVLSCMPSTAMLLYWANSLVDLFLCNLHVQFSARLHLWGMITPV